MMKSVTDNFPSLNVIILFYLMFLPTNSSEIQYRTKWASEKHHDLWCYRCDTMVDGESCLDLHGNYSWMNMKCSKEQKKCQVIMSEYELCMKNEEIFMRISRKIPSIWFFQEM
ncbi:uncharacterized protein LOC123316110 isoform X2 [Coccinella septempunctata]|uniref:uncharacterized protein LOC123316110 isoform X2 n=1 Tax=Coccinella septempunctata TaxID=41139 RepID=UPI001D0679D9|nr:uncharacterized protein LOC123316110 isoform X2 [Coccinella septempunctata]